MTLDRAKRIGLSIFILLTSVCMLGNTSPEVCEFVITPKKFQRIFWQDFLIEFPNIYSRADHRAYQTGTVVFLDGDARPALNLFARQKIDETDDGMLSRTTRLSLRTTDGSNLIDIIINDLGVDIAKRSVMQELLTGRLPLSLIEPGLREKNISVSGERIGHMKLKYSIKGEESKDKQVLLSFIRNARKRFSIQEIQSAGSRDVTWSVNSSKGSKKSTSLRASRSKSDWMLFGEERYSLGDRDCTPARYQEVFGSLQRSIVYYRGLLNRAIDTAFCYPDCDGSKAEGNGR